MTAEPFGWHLMLDLHGCNLDAITSSGRIAEFATQLCDLIDMRPFGQPLVVRFGYADPKTTGYSLVQLIETSCIAGHFSDHRRSAHLDVFSCRRFDPAVAVGHALEVFGGRVAQQRWLERP